MAQLLEFRVGKPEFAPERPVCEAPWGVHLNSRFAKPEFQAVSPASEANIHKLMFLGLGFADSVQTWEHFFGLVAGIVIADF